MSLVPSIPVDTLAQWMTTHRAYVAAEALMVWDIMITLDEEIAYVWSGRVTWGKVLYFFNRYVPPILFIFDLWFQLGKELSIPFCKHLWLSPTIIGIVVFSTIEFTLVLRIHALYRSKKILGFLTTLCVLSTGTMIATTLFWFCNRMKWLPPNTMPMPGCTTMCEGPSCRTLLVLFWVPFFVFELAVFVLTVHHTLLNCTPRPSGSLVWSVLRMVKGSSDGPKLVSVMYRDGIVYYLIMIVISMFNLIIWIAAPPTLYYLGSGFMRSLQSMICSRLMLNIRRTVDSTKGFRPSRNLDSFSLQEGGWILNTHNPGSME